jgi:hypothetical protein
VISKSEERRGEGAKERSEAAALLPEAKSESMEKSGEEEESLESGFSGLKPGKGEESLERLLKRREGRRAKRRREHGQDRRRAKRSLASDKDNRKEKGEGEAPP